MCFKMNQIETVLEELYANNQSKLRQICNKEMGKFGGLSQKDFDDFYSRAGYELNLAKETYDASKGKSFFDYACGVIRLSVRKEMTDRNRSKRQLFLDKKEKDKNGDIVNRREYISNISIDMPVGDENGVTVGDTLQSDFNIDYVLIENERGLEDERLEKFLGNLPKIQRQIVEMKMEDVSVFEIKRRLGLSDRKYNQHCKELKSFANISVMFRDENQTKFKEEERKMGTTTQTMENCKTDRISIASIIKKIDKHMIRFDHPLQRESDQWSPSMKGNLVSDILQGNKLHPLIFAEQIINGVPIIWDLDGKQRCTNAYLFSKNGYKVSKNIRRGIIRYQITQKDKNGNDILDANGFPIAVNAEFDIRGKRFSDLPEELRDKFMDYSFNYDQYLNCSEEDIGYHIERYNDGKPMTSPQKGITKLGTEYAESVKSISNMPFFKDMGGYKVSEFKNGAVNRVVVESVMAANYLEKWNRLEDICKYIRDNADAAVFDEFEDMVQRLERVVTDDVSDMFDSKDSFLWFGLFARFVKSGTDDTKFIGFMAEFSKTLHSKAIEGVSFDDILAESKSTKDKGIVTKKINHLEKLMKEYLAGQKSEGGSAEAFIAEALDMDEQTVQTDMDFYNASLDVLLEHTVRVDSELRNKENRLSLLAMMVYSYKEDKDLDNWMAEYAKRHNSYYRNQSKNFLRMKSDFEKYLKEGRKSA